MQENIEKRVLIIGGGFGGIQTAISLVKKNLKNTKITLISDRDNFQYYPGLYRVVTGASPIEVSISLSEILPKKVELIIDPVINIDLQNKKVDTKNGKSLTYDTVVVALGSETTYFNLPGIAELSFGFKSVEEALTLKKHIVSLFEEHEKVEKGDLIFQFHVIVVGGGPSGIEVAGDLAYFMRDLAKEYKVDPSLITIDIVEGGSRLLPTLPEKVSARILSRLRSIGINVFLNRTMEKEEVEQVFIKGMSIRSKTVIWTAGTQLNSLIPKIVGLQFSPRKKVEVNEYLEAKDMKDVFIIGDIANTQYTGLAQTAIHNAKYVAEVIANHSSNKNTKIYKPENVAFSIPVGIDWGVFSAGNISFYGFFAYVVRHVIDFVFFYQILSLPKLFGLFFKGWKYRKLKVE
ncbi:MAG: FAD-dependent oxidoreductase [Candidatus Nomurabacteria bacterium]|nr:FAD-dependent oxidoreductase [Candidatus Nomurabacteria bacterium]